MKDTKFLVALIIIVVLAIALLYFTLVGPKLQGYIIAKQVQAQENIVNSILDLVNRQGYVSIGNGENSVILIKYQPPEQQQNTQAESAESSVEVLN